MTGRTQGGGGRGEGGAAPCAAAGSHWWPRRAGRFQAQRHFLTFKGLELRLSAWWGRGVLKLGVRVWVVSAQGRGWGIGDAADLACWSKFFAEFQLCTRPLGSHRENWAAPRRFPGSERKETTGEGEGRRRVSMWPEQPECCLYPFPGITWPPALGTVSKEYHE